MIASESPAPTDPLGEGPHLAGDVGDSARPLTTHPSFGQQFPEVAARRIHQPISASEDTMNMCDPLNTHQWSDGVAPHQIHQSGRIILHHRCSRCGRDFAREFDGLDGSDWQTAYVGAIRIELLVESVNERWVGEECPGQLRPDDDAARSMLRS